MFYIAIIAHLFEKASEHAMKKICQNLAAPKRREAEPVRAALRLRNRPAKNGGMTMKKRGWIHLLALALCLALLVPALADGASGWVADGQAGSLTAPTAAPDAEAALAGGKGGVGAYLDGLGGLYLTGYDGTMSANYAAQIVHVDENEVLYLAGEAIDDLGGTLMRLDLSDFSETAIADGVYRACAVSADTVYYISAIDRAQLMRADVRNAVVEAAATASANMTALALLPEGLVAQLEGEAGTLLYNERAGGFAPCAYQIPADAAYADGIYLRLSDEGMLSMQALDTGEVEFIDFGVEDFAYLDGTVYYISAVAGQRRLKAFDPAQMSWRMVATPAGNVTQLAASAQALFLLDEGTGEVFRLAEDGLEAFDRCDLEGLASEGYALSGLRLEALSGLVNLYGVFAPEDLEAESGTGQTTPTFTFGDAPVETEDPRDETRLIASWTVMGEDTTVDVLKPQEAYGTLSRGSRGEAVRKLQSRLIELGYLDDDADGIFGPNTQYAVRLLQTDLPGAALRSTAWRRRSCRTCSSTRTCPPTIPTRRFRAAIPACASPFCRIACANWASWPTARTAFTASARRRP